MTFGLRSLRFGAIAASAGGGDPALYIPPNAIFAARSDNVATAGTDITALTDQSPSASDGTGVSVTAYPQLDSSTYGRPVIQGTNGQGYFSMPSAIATAILGGGDLPFTAAGVTMADNGDEVLGFGAAIGSGAYLRFRVASGERLQLEKSDGSTTVSILANGFTAANWHSWVIRQNGTTVDAWIDSTTKVLTAAAQNVGDCTGAPTEGRFLTRVGVSSCLGSQSHSALLISDAAESDGEVANIINNLNAWKALL